MNTLHLAATAARRLVAAALVTLLAGCASSPPGAPMQRETRWGPVVGADDSAASGTWSWKGVPYAAPPVGELRWRAPQDPPRWTQPRSATVFAPACVQTGRLYGPGLNNRYDETIGSTLGQTVGSEDCLFLNIWTPASRPARPRPVLVFVHGGSNVTGYTADPVYDGAVLAREQDMVVVSVNYRLGVFGFLDLAALKTGRRLRRQPAAVVHPVVPARLERIEVVALHRARPRSERLAVAAQQLRRGVGEREGLRRVVVAGDELRPLGVDAVQRQPQPRARQQHRVIVHEGGLHQLDITVVEAGVGSDELFAQFLEPVDHPLQPRLLAHRRRQQREHARQRRRRLGVAETLARRLHQQRLAARQVEVEEGLLELHRCAVDLDAVEVARQDALARGRRALDVQAIGQHGGVAAAVAVGDDVRVHQAHGPAPGARWGCAVCAGAKALRNP